MANLFWKIKDKTKSLLATPFKSEEEFEKIIFETQEILEDIFLIKRQIRGGNKNGIPDIVGIDSDGNICIVEMKNVTVDATIIPQVLQYAFWAESNPDSVKSLWLELDEKPDVSISWEKLEVRIIVIAPKILQSTLGIVEKINYQVDLIEVNRWVDGDNQLLFVKKLEFDEKKIKSKPASGLPTYNLEFYKNNYNKDSAKHFVDYVLQVEKIVHTKEWNLETKFNKHYAVFKAGFFNLFGVKWLGTKSIGFFFKMTEKEAKTFNLPYRYDKQWNEAIFNIDFKKTKVEDFIPLFEHCYKQFSGDE